MKTLSFAKLLKKHCLRKGVKLFCTAALLLLCVAALIYNVNLYTSKTTTVENSPFKYSFKADSSYQVKVIPSEFYPNDILAEGQLYPSKLVKSVLLDFSAEFNGSEASQIQCTYSISSGVDAYQTAGEGKSIIFNKTDVLVPLKTVAAENETVLKINEPIAFPFNKYTGFIERANATIGGAFSKEIFIKMEGTLISKSKYGTVNQPFTCTLTYPTASNIFSFTKSEPISQESALTENVNIPLTASLHSKILGALAALVVVLLLVFVILGTRLPTPQENYQFAINKLFRKYGSRMAKITYPIDLAAAAKINVHDFASLLRIAEEMATPIFYQPEADGSPLDGKFFVKGKTEYFVYTLAKPQAPTPLAPLPAVLKAKKGSKATDQAQA